MRKSGVVAISCTRGMSARRPVLLGFAAARVLHSVSFADVLDEDAGRGYQRRMNSAHSLDFRKYIQQADSTTIPLTFNLRPSDQNAWRLLDRKAETLLEIQEGA